MNDERKKARKRLTLIFILYICIALVCFGIFGYIVVTTRGTDAVNDRLVSISKIIVLVGVFFLVIAFGYLLPGLISSKKGNGADSSDIFDEMNMRRALEKYLPAGETILAGIHAIANESSVTCVFGECVLTEDKLLPSQNGETVAISKTKYSTYDIYLGITQHSFVVADCEACRYFYEFNKTPTNSETDIKAVTADILLKDIGKCFPLTDIESCKTKNGFGGSVNCVVTMKNGSYFKLVLPKNGGLSGGMPHHTEFRDAILACLSERCS